jgi:KTSC domain
MERLALDSTILGWARYSPQDHVLELGFRTGKVYIYFDVPLHSYQGLVRAESKGRYFNLHIRNHFRVQPATALSAGSQTK